MLRHCGSDSSKKSAKIYLKLKGVFKTCEQCAIVKARQKNIIKNKKGGSQVTGEQLYLNISSNNNLS
jgi:hypothetical protein